MTQDDNEFAAKLTNQYYDNSALGAYKECPRRYQLRHQKHWRGQGISTALAFGLSWHTAMDVVWIHCKKLPANALLDCAHESFIQTWIEQGLPAPTTLTLEQIEQLNPRTPSIAREMLKAYIEKNWKMLQDAELLAPEQPFAVPIPLTEGKWYIGRLDKVINYNGATIGLEHKTTTEYKKDGGFRSTYVEGWYSDSQIKGYEFGGGLFFPNLSQIWVDAALVHKQVRAFRFIPVAHQLPLLEEWIRDTREWIERIERDAAREYFPKNENSCNGKFGNCQFLDICRTTPDHQLPSVPPDGYVEDKWEPFSILHLDRVISGRQDKE